MKNAILVHGMPYKEEYFSDKYPSSSNSHWFPWLQKQLMMKGIYTQTPEIPDSYKPEYRKWKKEFERFEINKETILVGHSCGGGFLLRWLTENKIKVNQLVLVAPWLDPDRQYTTTFFDFTIDPEITKRVNEIHIFISNDDSADIRNSFETIKEALPRSVIHTYEDKGHFTYGEMKTKKFPELLNAILK